METGARLQCGGPIFLRISPPPLWYLRLWAARRRNQPRDWSPKPLSVDLKMAQTPPSVLQSHHSRWTYTCRYSIFELYIYYNLSSVYVRCTHFCTHPMASYDQMCNFDHLYMPNCHVGNHESADFEQKIQGHQSSILISMFIQMMDLHHS